MRRMALIAAGIAFGLMVLAGEQAKETESQPDPELKKAQQILQEFAREREVEGKYRKYLSASITKSANAYYESGKFVEARKELLKALELDPANEDAKELLTKAEIMLGIRSPDPLKARVEEQKVALQLARMELDKHFGKAKRLFESSLYEEAIMKSQTVKGMASGLAAKMNVQNYLDQANFFISESHRALEEKLRKEEDARLQEARTRAEKRKEEEKTLWEETLQSKWREAMGYFDRGKYKKAEDLAEQLRREVMDVAPKHQMVAIAEALRVSAKTADRERAVRSSQVTKQEMTERWVQESHEAQIPLFHVVTFPPPEVWREVEIEAEEVLEGEAEEDEPWKEALKLKLEKTIPSIDFNGTPLSDAVAFLNELTDANVVLDSDVTVTGDTVTLSLSNVSLEEAVRWICKLSNLKFALKDNAVFITQKDRVVEDMVLRRYDVSDILAPLENFEAEASGFGTGGETGGFGGVGGSTSGGGLGGGIGGFEDEDEDEDEFTGDELVRFIRSMITPPRGWADIEEEDF